MNTGSSRQFGGYYGVVPEFIVEGPYYYHNWLCFCSQRACPEGQLSFEGTPPTSMSQLQAFPEGLHARLRGFIHSNLIGPRPGKSF